MAEETRRSRYPRVVGEDRFSRGRAGTLRAVLDRLVRLQGQPTSRARLARDLGLSKTTVSSVVDDCVQVGLLQEAEDRGYPNSRGRPAVPFAFTPGAVVVGGVELGLTKLRMVLADPGGRILSDSELDSPGLHARPVDYVDMIGAGMEALLAEAGIARGRLLGIGVGTPGLADPAEGVIRAAYDFDWYDVPLGPMLTERTGVPVVLANRGKMGALGEYEQGEGRGRQNVVYIRLGTGVTGGMILAGELYWGSVGAGEAIGHILAVPDGELCGCGSRGCLMTVASMPALSRRVRRLLKRGEPSVVHDIVGGDLSRIDGTIVLEAARAGDPTCLSVIREAGERIGVVVSGLVNLLSPDVVVIGGPMSAAGEPLMQAIRQSLREHTLSYLYNHVDIVPTRLGSRAGAVGAVYYVLRYTPLLADYVMQAALRAPSGA
ncbi:MAG: ROK family protein [Anaerolineae bacterium]|nr:ROK family protein [Anaerolineae bacterium]